MDPSAWRHKLIVPMLIDLVGLEWLDLSGELDGDVITLLAAHKVLQVPVFPCMWPPGAGVWCIGTIWACGTFRNIAPWLRNIWVPWAC